MKHYCHAKGCKEQVPPSKLFCRQHWFAVPKDLRDRVWATYVPGQEKTKRPSREYLAAARAAIDWLRQRAEVGVVEVNGNE